MAAAGSRVHAWALVLLFFVMLNATGVLYWAADLEVSAGLRLLLGALAIVVFWRLLEAECASSRLTHPLDMGYFLYLTSFVLVPYYFWRTQRWRGVLKVLALACMWLGTFAVWWIVAWLLVPE